MASIPPGYYPDPVPSQDPGAPPTLRWWDGNGWSAHTQPAPMESYPTYQSPYAAQGSRDTTPDGQRLSGWWRRVGASVLDSVVVLLITVPVTWPWLTGWLHAQIDYQRELQDKIAAGQTVSPFGGLTVGYADQVVFTLVGFLIYLAYHALFLKWRSATPGKMALGIKVRPRELDGPLSWAVIAKRLLVQSFATPAGLIPVVGSLLGFFMLLDALWPLWDGRRQALHEKWAGTNVVHTRP